MKLFIKKVIQFSLVLNFLIFLRIAFIPYYTGNNLFQQKLNSFSSKSDYNAVLFGSSRVFRHINPAILDSCTKEILPFKAYNFGVGGGFNPEIYYLYENFIESINKNEEGLKYAILEIQPLHQYSSVNRNTTRGTYWNDLSTLKYSISYILNAEYSLEKKYKLILDYLSITIYRFFDISNIGLSFKDESFTSGIHGYYSYDANYKEGTSEERVTFDHIRKNFLKNKAQLNNEKIKAAQNIPKYINSFYNKAHLSYLKKLITKSSEKGLHLIFILPPRLPDTHYQELVPILQKIPFNNSLFMADIQSNQHFYELDYLYDESHFNEKGATLFSIKLANKLKELLIENKETIVFSSSDNYK